MVADVEGLIESSQIKVSAEAQQGVEKYSKRIDRVYFYFGARPFICSFWTPSPSPFDYALLPVVY